MERQTTDRGFAIYADLKDSYGASVRVIESSAAVVEGDDRGPWVWIFVEGGAVERNDGSAHVDIRDAVTIRDALSAFIEDNGLDLEVKEEKDS